TGSSPRNDRPNADGRWSSARSAASRELVGGQLPVPAARRGKPGGHRGHWRDRMDFHHPRARVLHPGDEGRLVDGGVADWHAVRVNRDLAEPLPRPAVLVLLAAVPRASPGLNRDGGQRSTTDTRPELRRPVQRTQPVAHLAGPGTGGRAEPGSLV